MEKYRAQYLYEYAVESIKDDQVFPVFVPSYSRPTATILTEHLRVDNTLPIVLCVREEQLDMYKQWWSVFPILPLRGVHDVSETRQAVLEEAGKWYDNIYMFDDKLNELEYLIPSYTSGGKPAMRSSHLTTGFRPRKIDVLKMWQSELLFRKDDKIALSSAQYRPDSWHMKNADAAYSYNSGDCIRAIHINTKLLSANNIRYLPLSVAGTEDYALQFQVMEKGLNTIVIKDLMYGMSGTAATPGGCLQSAADSGVTIEERWKTLTENAKAFYGDHPGIRYTKTKRTELDTIKFNWKYWRNQDEHCT